MYSVEESRLGTLLITRIEGGAERSMIMSEFDSNVIAFPNGGRGVVKGMSDEDFQRFEELLEEDYKQRRDPVLFNAVNSDGETVQVSLDELEEDMMNGSLGLNGWQDSYKDALHPHMQDYWWWMASSEERQAMVCVFVKQFHLLISGNQVPGDTFDYQRGVFAAEEVFEGIAPELEEDFGIPIDAEAAALREGKFSAYMMMQLKEVVCWFLQSLKLVPPVLNWQPVDEADMLVMWYKLGLNVVFDRFNPDNL